MLLSLIGSNVCAQRSDSVYRHPPSEASLNLGINISLGAALTYYYGQGNRNIGKFENERLNWQVNAMAGFTIATNQSGKRTMIGIFGAYGFNNDKTVSNILSDHKYITTATQQSTANNYFHLEGGLLIGEVLRVSTGIGQQNFDEQTLISSSGSITRTNVLKYNSSTIGFQFKFGSVSWVINCNIASGKDYNTTIITPSTGLQFIF